MNKREAISLLKDSAPAIRAMGATALYLFGSTARDEAQPGSDLDLFIDTDPAAKFSLFDLAGIKLFLEERCPGRIDVTTRASLHPMLRADIESEAIRVF